MKWGFGWEAGPFEIWDLIGVKRSTEKMKSQGEKVPKWVQTMLNTGRTAFYATKNAIPNYWCPKEKKL